MTLSVFPMIFGRRVILVSVCFKYIKVVKRMLVKPGRKIEFMITFKTP